MESFIGEWVGKKVSVAWQVASQSVVKDFFGGSDAGYLEGKLMKIGEAGALLEHAKGITLFPASSVLHVSLLQTT